MRRQEAGFRIQDSALGALNISRLVTDSRQVEAGDTFVAYPGEKLDGNRYAPDKYVSSFVGFAPASKPRLIVAVMIDEPGAGHYYGGTVAAPVFSEVMAGALRMLSAAPDAPVDNVLLPPPGTQVIREEV